MPRAASGSLFLVSAEAYCGPVQTGSGTGGVSVHDDGAGVPP
jgi:hypothetical protein